MSKQIVLLVLLLGLCGSVAAQQEDAVVVATPLQQMPG